MVMSLFAAATLTFIILQEIFKTIPSDGNLLTFLVINFPVFTEKEIKRG